MSDVARKALGNPTGPRPEKPRHRGGSFGGRPSPCPACRGFHVFGGTGWVEEGVLDPADPGEIGNACPALHHDGGGE
jgi:hypothetical protein